MVHRIVHRVASGEALDFWADRFGEESVPFERDHAGLRFADPEGLAHELIVGHHRRRTADRRASRGSGRGRAARLRGRARVQRQPRRLGADARVADGRSTHRRRGSLRAARPAARRLDRLRSRSRRARPPERGRRAPRRVGHRRRRHAELDRPGRPRPACRTRATSTATTSTRCTSASRAESCTSSRPRSPASSSTACRWRSSVRR